VAVRVVAEAATLSLQVAPEQVVKETMEETPILALTLGAVAVVVLVK
jgi:hypothetical protein